LDFCWRLHRGSGTTSDLMADRFRTKEEFRRILRYRSRTFSGVHRRIAQFVQDNYQQFIFLRAVEVAAKAGVSQASVTRFARLLGFQGYKAFVRRLQELARMDLRAPERMYYSLRHRDGHLQRIVTSEVENLQQVSAMVRQASFRRLVNQISSASRVILAGFRASRSLADHFGYFLRYIHPNVEILTEGGSLIYDRLLSVDKRETLIVLLVFPRYPQEALDFLRVVVTDGFRVACLTDSPSSPVCHETRNVVLAPISLTGLFDSYCAPMLMISLLLHEIGRSQSARTRTMLEAFERLVIRGGTFFSDASSRPAHDRERQDRLVR